MSDENPTQEQPQARSFEDRLFMRLDAIEARFGGMEDRLSGIENELGEVKTHLSVVESRLDNLEEKVDARLRETRPIWEGVLMRLDSMEERFKSVEEKMDTLTRYFQELHKDMMYMRSRINKLEDIVLPPLS